MGISSLKKIAILINGDTESEGREVHHENIAKAAEKLKHHGYEVYSLDSERTLVKGVNYSGPATKTNLENLVSGLEYRTNDGAELLIYTTGHGNPDSQGCLVLNASNECLYPDSFVKIIGRLKYAQRIFIMDQCGSGSWAQFMSNPKTLFISGGLGKQTVWCVPFSDMIWGSDKKGDDKNHDGVISWGELFAKAARNVYKDGRSTPIFYKGDSFIDRGLGIKLATAKFSKSLKIVSSEKQLLQQLKRLEPGDFAIVCFSPPESTFYDATFESLSGKSGGKYLYISVKSDDERLQKHFGIGNGPVVKVFGYGDLLGIPASNIYDPQQIIRQPDLENISSDYIVGVLRGNDTTLKTLILLQAEEWGWKNFILSEVRELINSKNANVKIATIMLLIKDMNEEKIIETIKSNVQLFLKGLDSQIPSLRFKAAVALVGAGYHERNPKIKRKLAGSLKTLLNSKNYQTSAGSAAVLVRIGVDDKRIIPVLIRGLGHGIRKDIRLLSAGSLGQMGKKAVSALQSLEAFSNDKDPEIREAVRGTINQIKAILNK